ncbi:MAG TPA: ABC transporter permease [Trebonia sp.]|jgi:peptide/nickel transport system permease protein|nr:ABC transporter permease [Trebonia sp.]
MVTFIIRRVLRTILLLLAVSFVTFCIFFLLPRLAGQTTADLAAQYTGRNPSPDAIQQMIVKLGLNEPLPVQYWKYVSGIIVGQHFNDGPSVTYCPPPCFGYSFRNDQPVWPQMMSDLPVTACLAAGAAILWLCGGVAIGVLSALRRGSVWDRLSMGIALAGVSLPVFFTGGLALLIFAVKLKVFPNSGYVNLAQSPVQWFEHLVLPWISLAFLYAALYARLTRAGMLETMSEDFIRTARAKGLRERKVIIEHGLRAALTPILTIFGLDLGLLLGGAILTETTFSMQGLGAFTVMSIQNQDFPSVEGVVMLAAFFIVLMNMIVDILYAAVDPRVRTA